MAVVQAAAPLPLMDRPGNCVVSVFPARGGVLVGEDAGRPLARGGRVEGHGVHLAPGGDRLRRVHLAATDQLHLGTLGEGRLPGALDTVMVTGTLVAPLGMWTGLPGRSAAPLGGDLQGRARRDAEERGLPADNRHGAIASVADPDDRTGRCWHR